MSTLIHSLVLSLRWRNDGGSGALLFVILALQISLFSTHHLANFHAGETKDLGNKLTQFGLGASLKATAELHPFLGSVASILSRRVAWSLPATRTAPLPVHALPLFLSLSASLPLSLCATTLTAAVTSFRHAGRQIPIPCSRLPRNSNVTASVPLLPPSLLRSCACPPVRKAFKCLGVVAAYAVSVCLSVPLPRPAFDDIYICESQLIAVEKSSLVFWVFRVDCEKISPNFPLSLIN